MAKKISPSWIFFSIKILIIVMMIPKSTSHPWYWGSDCDNNTMFAKNSQYQADLNTLFDYLSSNSTKPNGYHQAISSNGNTTNETIYGHFLCHGDASVTACKNCVNNATITDLPITYCANRKEATIWYDDCLVRYSNHSFFGKLDDSTWLALSTKNITGNMTRFMELMKNMMVNDIALHAAAGGSKKKFATNMVNNQNASDKIYGMGQCTPDLNRMDCDTCINDAVNRFTVAKGGRSWTRSCVTRFELYPIFHVSSPQPSPPPIISSPQPSNGHSRRKRTILLVALSTSSAVVSILLLFGVWTCMRRRKIVQASNMEISEIKKAALDSLQFELNTIRAATNNFSTENKLGEGGFGEVYKGVLENGQEIAVKRLSKNSGQGDVEFKTEVVLVAKLRHKNLVKLLGFCVAFEEKILVYEFLPKSSLDRLLFDPTSQAFLDWQTRFNIIVGIARGLLYLHEDSPLKVIHRDLKSSNILLDENLNPKIADFGLAKLFGVDQTQGDTRRIVGTYGYMAPEYAITGHFSVKSDVYSFGVLVLEIVSGQRNRFYGRMQLEEALLHRAWRLWNEEKTLDLVDTTLSNNFPREEVTKCIHIGLLCIQEDAVARPRTTSIVAALNGQVYNLPIPKPPNFFGIATNIEDNDEMQPAFEGVYTGTKTITELYPRD